MSSESKSIEKDEVEIWTQKERVIGPFGPVHIGCKSPHGEGSIVIGSYPALGHYDHVRPRRCCWCQRWVSQEVEEWLDNE